MKNYSFAAFGILLLTLYSSCTTRSNCKPQTIQAMYLRAQTPTTDTVARVIRCEKGTDFSKKLDSSYVPVKSFPDSMIHSGSPAGVFSYDFSGNGHDYLIMLLPSGKTHKIKNIQIGNEKSYGSRLTMCSLDYNLNGKDVKKGTHEAEAGEAGNVIEWLEE